MELTTFTTCVIPSLGSGHCSRCPYIDNSAASKNFIHSPLLLSDADFSAHSLWSTRAPALFVLFFFLTCVRPLHKSLLRDCLDQLIAVSPSMLVMSNDETRETICCTGKGSHGAHVDHHCKALRRKLLTKCIAIENGCDGTGALRA